ncbi:MAG: hypothetical protein AB7Y46_05900 [Armatimonadota bacterium]
MWNATAAVIGLLVAGGAAFATGYVADPGFESAKAWTAYPGTEDPFVFDRNVKRSGEQAIRITNDSADDARGAMQRVTVDEGTIVPIQVVGWSRAKNVSGPRSNHYSIWLDIEYVDDTRPGRVDDWVQLPFEVGTHDWQRVETIFTPARPIRHFTIYALFRSHSGTVWFDDVSVTPLLSTRSSGAPEDFTEPAPGLVPAEFTAAVAAADPAETVVMVTREQLQDYHRDAPAGSVDGKPLTFEGDRALWRGRLSFDESTLSADAAATEPGLHVRPLVGRWSETELAVTAVGAQGNAYRVLIALPAGGPLRGVRFADWEPTFDTAAAHRIGDRVLLVNLLEVMSGTDTCRWVLPGEDVRAGISIPERDPAAEVTLAAGNDLALHFSATGALAAIETRGQELALAPGPASGGWLGGEAGLYVGDLFAGKLLRVSGEPQAGDDRVTVAGSVEELELAASATFRAVNGLVLVEGEVRDLRGQQRAIDLVLKLPVRLADSDVIWHDITTGMPVGASGRVEITSYPWLSVTGAGWGLGLGIDGHYPARQSILYDPDEGLLHARIKLGIIHDARPHLQGRVPFGFAIMPVDPAWGGRDAAARYYAAYPDLFEARPHREGLWMFGRLRDAEIPNPEDFSYYEGPSALPDYLRAAGVLAAPYIIPNQRALTRLSRLPADYDEAMALLASEDPQADGWGGTGSREIIRAAAIVDAEGRFPITIRDDVGADVKPDPPIYNVVFPVNPDPDLPSGTEEMERVRGFAQMPDVGGVYTDSGSAWSARYLNFRADHFPHADLPLTYDDETGRVAIFGKAPPVEHWRAMGEILHPLGKVIFPNLGHAMADPWSWFAADICGSEQGNTTTEFLNYARTLAHHKPVLFLGYLQLMGRNTFLAEREGFLDQVRRCALMGIMPSIAIREGYLEFYQRNGDIYRLYVPIIKRLSAAGWEPVTHATVDAANVRVERFGPTEGMVYFTLLNTGAEGVSCNFRIDFDALGVRPSAMMTELISGKTGMGGRALLHLEPGELLVLAQTLEP